MLELLNEKLNFIKLNNDKSLDRIKLFEAIKEETEYEDDNKNRVNYTFKAKVNGIIPNLNIKVNTKGKTEEEICTLVINKLNDAITTNNFLSDGIKILKKIDPTINIKITPIYFEEGLIYRLTVNGKHKTFNDSEITTADFLKNLGYTDRNYLFACKLLDCNIKSKKITELINKLIENKEITLELLKDVSIDIKKDKEKIYSILYRIAVMNNIEIEKYNLFKKRRNYIEIFKTLNQDDICSKISMKYLQDAFRLNFIVHSPDKYKCLFKTEFENVEEKYKNYINTLEEKIEKYFISKEEKLNNILKKFNIKLAICDIDFLTDTYNVICVNSKQDNNDYQIRESNLKEDLTIIIKELKIE